MTRSSRGKKTKHHKSASREHRAPNEEPAAEGGGEAVEMAAAEGDASSPADPDAQPVAPEDEGPDAADPLETMRAERDAFQEKWLRAAAEMDNLRKRTRRELVDTRRHAQADVLRPILGVMDNFERALQSLHENKENADLEKFLEGVDMIFQNFQGVLRDLGVVPMEALDQEFDPVYHEAVGRLHREGVEPDQVIEIVQSGFMFGDQVLRPARVIISA